MPTLTKEQLTAIAAIAAGKTNIDAAKEAGVSRSSVSRWVKNPDFQAEIERRKQQAIATHQKLADEIQTAEISEFYQDLRKYRDSLIQAYKTRIARALKIREKMGRRFDDLPDEAYSPKDLASLMGIAEQMLDGGFKGWSELLAIDELLSKVDGQQPRD